MHAVSIVGETRGNRHDIALAVPRRQVFVGPSWLPPRSTPDRELVRATDRGFVLAREQLGPSYRAALGMVAFVHLREDRVGDRVALEDEGIRMHGTGNLTSLSNGVSHGCHRLLGRSVVRLADFVLAHHDHVRHGDTFTYYRRVVRYGNRFPIATDSLGYRIELVPPIPVVVLPGAFIADAHRVERTAGHVPCSTTGMLPLPPWSLHARLVMDHDDIDAFLDRLIAAFRTGDREVAARAFAELEARLTAHFAMEEDLLFSDFARVEPREAEDLRAEHRTIRAQLAALGIGVDLHGVRLSAIEELALVVRRHAVRENALLYRWADRELSDPARRVVCQRFSPATAATEAV